LFRILFSALVLLLFTSATAQAAKPVPGDACSNLNYYTTTGGSETGGIIYFLICDGTNWQPAGIYSHASHNAGLGYGMLYTSGGTYETAVGDYAMNHTTGNYNTAVGYAALYSNTTGVYNAAFGYQALYYNTTVQFNTAMGINALENIATTSENTAVGHSALVADTGNYNTALGSNAGAAATTGTGNTLIGSGAGYFVTSGQTNTIIGYNAASTILTTGSNNILIGTSSAVTTPAAGTSNFLNIGNTIFATSTMTGTVASPAGNVGINTTAPSAALHVIGDIKYTGLLSDVSDRRLKDNVAPLGPQLGKITSLQPVSFVMKEDPEHRTEFGLIAQDAEAIYPNLVTTAPDGTKALAYTGLIAPLIEAAKEQQAEINQLRAGLAVVFLGGVFFIWRNRAKSKM
jgi:Chaperone of endosialidase